MYGSSAPLKYSTVISLLYKNKWLVKRPKDQVSVICKLELFSGEFLKLLSPLQEAFLKQYLLLKYGNEVLLMQFLFDFV